LPAFGTVDFEHPWYGKMRAWNVVLKDSKVGQFTLQMAGSMGDDTIDDLNYYTEVPAK
jgi:hypothetical protein